MPLVLIILGMSNVRLYFENHPVTAISLLTTAGSLTLLAAGMGGFKSTHNQAVDCLWYYFSSGYVADHSTMACFCGTAFFGRPDRTYRSGNLAHILRNNSIGTKGRGSCPGQERHIKHINDAVLGALFTN
ncbi:MAG TPA: hypothetical protein VHP38_00885 [Ruminiclostridium sp.]|nr:hypothetical protein [Ruminiclostridium sp.]